MLKYTKILAPLFGALLLGACGGFQLQEAQMATPSGPNFNTGLYNGYLELADSEYREADYADSDVFANRAIEAASNGSVMPEAIDMRHLPAEAAHAQVMFDCWMQEQEENRQPKDIEVCRAGFMMALAQIEPAPKVAAPAPAPTLAMPGPYVVFFDFDDDKLTPNAKTVLAKVAREAKIATVMANGHTNLAGDPNYITSLSMRRANAVMSYLLESGLVWWFAK